MPKRDRKLGNTQFMTPNQPPILTSPFPCQIYMKMNMDCVKKQWALDGRAQQFFYASFLASR